MSKFAKQVMAGIFLDLWKLTGYRTRKITRFSAEDDLKCIAIFSTTALGDFLLNTPAIRAIKQRWPAARLVLILNKRNALLVEGSSLFDHVFYWNGKFNDALTLAGKLKALHVDASFILHSRSPYDIVVASLARSPVILKDVYYNDYLGRDDFYLNRFLSASYDSRRGGNIHLIQQKVKLLQSVGIDVPSLEMFIPAPIIPEQRQRRAVGIQAATSVEVRCWPVEKFTQLIQTLLTRYPDIDIELLGGPGDAARNQRIIEGLTENHARVVNYGGKTNLRQLAEKIASQTCLVVGDTGPLHVAIATKTPVVGLFGGQMYVDGAQPLQDREIHQVLKAPDEDVGIASLEVGQVLAAVEQCLARGA